VSNTVTQEKQKLQIAATVSNTVTQEKQKLHLVSRAWMLLKGMKHDKHGKDGHSGSSKKLTVSFE
jgi:hypothetical protein